jgi:hypothetical protein
VGKYRTQESNVTTRKNPIDLRPFQSRAELAMQQALEMKYRGVAIPCVVAALEAQKPIDKDTPRTKSD